MEFRTKLKIPHYVNRIGLHDKIVSAGSCFAENIGRRFESIKTDILINPFGIIFNPVSIFDLFTNSLEEQPADPDGFVRRDGNWYHLDCHSSLSARTKEGLMDKTEVISRQLVRALEETDFVIFTPGTAIVYENIATGKTVANCHKLPSSYFRKRMLTVEEIEASFRNFYKTFRRINPDARILFTVSPIRHIKDTLQVNSLSKSTLLLAVSRLVAEDDRISYFPAYEIMIDELRDYRFYKDDMIHPSELAETYIWNRLSESLFSQELNDFVVKWDKLRRSLAHKPFDIQSVNHQQFLSGLLKDLYQVNKIKDVSGEIKEVKAQLIS